jgi:hypothetical protein
MSHLPAILRPYDLPEAIGVAETARQAGTFCTLLGRVLPMTVSGEVQHGISAELQRILQECEGRSRSIPTASDRQGANGTLLALPAPNGLQPH